MKNIYLLILCLLIFQTLIHGQDLRLYETENLSVEDGLPEEEVYHAIQDKEGYVWFATNNGLSKYNGVKHKVFDTKDGLPTNCVFHLFPQQDSSIVGVSSSGEFFRVQDDKVESILHPDSSKKYIKPGNFPFAFYEDEKGIYHIGSRDGEFLFNKKGALIGREKLSDEEFNRIDIRETPKGHFFGSTSYFSYGDKKARNLVILRDHDTLEIRLDEEGSNLISVYGSIDKNHIAFHSLYEFFVFNKRTQKLLSLKTTYRCIGIEIIDGQIFVLSEKNGVKCYELENDQIILKYEILKGLSISSILRTKGGVYYLTTLEDGIRKINSNLPQKLIEVSNEENITCFSFTNSSFALGHQSGRVLINPNRYIIPTNSKIFSISKIKGKYFVIADSIYVFDQEYRSTDLSEPLKSQTGRGLKEVYLWRDSLLICKGYTHLDLLNLHSQKLTSLLATTEKEFLYHFELINGITYISSYNNVYVINTLVSAEKTTYHTDSKVNLFFKAQNQVFGVQENMKIAAYSKENQKVNYHLIPFPKSVNRTITSIYHNEILHISTNNGVYSWSISSDFNSFELKNFEPIPMVQFIKIRNDSIYFTTKKKVFRKALQNLSIHYPKVKILKIIAEDKVFKPNHPIQLPFSKNDIEIKVDLLSFEKSFLHFRYKLEGHDKDYRYFENGAIKYSSLPPGNYTFRISATSDGVNYSPEKTVSIIISPPFWQTWWFLTLMTFSFIFLLYILIRYRIRQIKKRASINQALAELKSQALTAQLNPHLVFNVLNSIQGMVSEGEIEAANIYIARFSKFMRNSLNHSKVSVHSIQDEIEITKSYIELENLRFQDEINFELKVSIEDLSSKVPPLIVQPIIENSIRHGIRPELKTNGKVVIKFREDSSFLLIEIEDNGLGIDINQKFGDGMRITEERIKVRSKENQLIIIHPKKPTRIQIKLKK